MSFRKLLPALLLVAHAAAQTPSPQRFQISGTVVHGITGQPLAHAEVAIGISEHQGVLRDGVTDAQGNFSFSDLKRGKYWLAAQKRGFPRQGYQQHEDYWTGIAVGAGLVSESILFPLVPGASIVGTITNTENEAVPSAQVLLFRSGVDNGRRRFRMQEQVLTDDQGHYRFSHLLPGTYFVVVSAQPWYDQAPLMRYVQREGFEHSPDPDGTVTHAPPVLDVAYPVTFFPGVTDSNSASPIALKPGDHASADVMLAAVPSVHVRVRQPNADGYDASFTQMLFGNFPLNLRTQSARTQSGEIEVSGLAPGQYAANIQFYNDNEDSRTQMVNLAGDSEIDPVKAPPSSLSGTVKLGGDVAPAGAVVRLWNTVTDQSIDAAVVNQGEFEFSEAVVPGNYQVLTFNVPNATVARLSATGAETSGTTLRISRLGNIRLTVELTQALARVEGLALKDGKPSPQTMILLVPEDFERNPAGIRRDQSDSDGTFVLRSALPGKYTVVAIQNGWNLEWVYSQVLKPYLQRGTPLEVTADQKYQVRVEVH